MTNGVRHPPTEPNSPTPNFRRVTIRSTPDSTMAPKTPTRNSTSTSLRPSTEGFAAYIFYFTLILGILYWLYKHNERQRKQREEQHRRDFEQQKNCEAL